MAYKFPANEVITNKDKVMGVDLGVAIPATIAVNDDKYYYQYVGSAEEVLAFETQVANRRRRLSRATKWAGEGSRGRGRKKRMQAVDRIGDKIARFKQTKNHQWSRFIVDEAVRLGCGVIQLEDLSGISEGADKASGKLFLKRWTFFELQSYITYKAEEYGIEVIKIKPSYTSARCSDCGHIHVEEDKKLWRPKQDRFVCQACNSEGKRYVNADVNAARNIAIPQIDDVIKKDLKEIQKKA